jgi:hypothetical protein
MSPPNFCPGLANSGRACGAPGLLIWVESPNLLSCCRSQGEAIGVIADCVATPDGRFCIHELRRRPRWTTRHPASNRKQADCRPLLQQSPPNRGGPSGVTRGIYIHLGVMPVCTPFAPLQVPQGTQTTPSWMIWPQAPRPAASLQRKNWQFLCQTKGRLPKPLGCSPGGFLTVFA